jgi:hypothetical protein
MFVAKVLRQQTPLFVTIFIYSSSYWDEVNSFPSSHGPAYSRWQQHIRAAAIRAVIITWNNLVTLSSLLRRIR